MNAFIYTRPLWEWDIISPILQIHRQNSPFSVWGTYGQIFPVFSALSVYRRVQVLLSSAAAGILSISGNQAPEYEVRYPEYKTQRISFCLEELCFLLFLISCQIHSFPLTPSPFSLTSVLSGTMRGPRVRHGQEMTEPCKRQNSEVRQQEEPRRKDLETLSGQVSSVGKAVLSWSWYLRGISRKTIEASVLLSSKKMNKKNVDPLLNRQVI